MSHLHLDSTASMRSLYFSPLIPAAARVTEAFGHLCKAIPDARWLEQGCLRVLSQNTSGRGHVQQLSDQNMMTVIRQTMQASLHSKRRLAFITAVNSDVRDQLLREKSDPFWPSHHCGIITFTQPMVIIMSTRHMMRRSTGKSARCNIFMRLIYARRHYRIYLSRNRAVMMSASASMICAR